MSPRPETGGRRIRVCVVGLRGLPGVSGGVEAHCEQLYPRIAKDAALAVTIVARRPYVRERGPFTFKGTSVVPIWAVRRKYLEAFVHTACAVALARFRYSADIVHIHAIGPGLWTPLARLLGMKVVVTHHGEDYNRDKWNAFAKRALIAGEGASVRFADAVIVVSRELSRSLQQRNRRFASKIRYLPNGFDRFDSAPNPAEAQRSPLDDYSLKRGRYFLAVGRLVPEKGFQDLIAAYQQLDRPMPLVIAGGADHADQFSRTLVDGRVGGVVFTGVQSKERLRALYEGAALFVSASRHEGSPIAVLEAISLGVPVLLSDIGPHVEFGLPASHYFPVRDTSALARKLAVPPEEYRHAGIELVRDRDWDAVAVHTAGIYKAIAGRG